MTKLYYLTVYLLLIIPSAVFSQFSVAREWNEVLLEAIRNDFARPTIHARNLFHASIVMYDSWAVFDQQAETVFLGKRMGSYYCAFDDIEAPVDIEEARHSMMSYALLRLLNHRFISSPGSPESLNSFRTLFESYGYDPEFVSTDYSQGSYAALGNYLAEKLIAFGLTDGANESGGYESPQYSPVNSGLLLTNYDDNDLTDPNRWQPLDFTLFVDQSGNVIGESPTFLSPDWGQLVPFALKQEDLEILNNGFNSYVYNNPGAPNAIQDSDEDGIDDPYKWNFALVLSWSSHLDPDDTTLIDISPGAIGNTSLDDFPETFEAYKLFYDFTDGGDTGTGHDLNPVTGQPYTPMLVKRADYARALAEFWADGPDSETPPGHWFTILNYVNDHPLTVKKIGGTGATLSDLEWDVKCYLALAGAMHDSAINAWGIKGYYDYIRPISAIRYMATKGQSSDASLPSYDPHGLPLIPGLIELITAGDPLEGDSGENIGKVKVFSWKGPDFINDPETETAGVGWIPGTHWWPYQRPTFVTPPFAGYVSGHSTFSRAAAEVLTLLTGSEFFPGGMGTFDIEQDNFLVFENGPTASFTLQWATYQDASDQTSLSRIWGGIHPPVDDIPGRLIGDKIGKDAFALANNYFEGIAPNDFLVNTIGENCVNSNNGSIEITALVAGNYIAVLEGTEYPFSEFLHLDDLTAGTHDLCVYAVGEPASQNCYSLTITEIDDLQVSSKINQYGDSGKHSLSLQIDKGSPPFTVTMNNKIIGVFNDHEITVEVAAGDELTVRSKLPCEGDFKMTIPFNNSIRAYPNPANSVINVLMNRAMEGAVEMSVYDTAGRLIQRGKIEAHNNLLELPIQQLAPGLYFIKVPGIYKEPLRIIKQ